MKLTKIARTKQMLEIDFQDNYGKKWCNADQQVYNFAKQIFALADDKTSVTDGDNISVQYNENGGVRFITRISKAGQQSQPNQASQPQSNSPTCQDCGKALKDAKYKKCYTCNQKNKSSSSSSAPQSTGNLTKEQSIIRQSVAKATGGVISGLDGVDQNNVCEVFDIVFAHILSKVT